MGITPKQKQVLDFILEFQRDHGYAPSQQEIAGHFGYRSLGTVQNYLVRLEREGHLSKTLNARRGLQIVPQNPSPPIPLFPSTPTPPLFRPAMTLPLLGRVAAGRPIEAIENRDEFEVPPSMVLKGDNYVLQVVGDSMIEDGILDGDYVIVNKRSRANNGQTVVAMINDHATVKRYYRKGDRVELRPANSEFKTLVIESLVDADVEFRIEGVVVGVIRHLETHLD